MIWQIFLYVRWCWVLRFLQVVILSIVRARCKSAMHLDGHHMRTIVMRERRMATTVGLIILLLCFMYLPVLAAPFILHNLGYPI